MGWLLLYLLGPFLATRLLAATVQRVSGLSALKVARVLAGIPTGLALVCIYTIGQTDDARTGVQLSAFAMFLLYLSLGPWLAAGLFWVQKRRAEAPVEEGIGFSPNAKG